MSGMERRPDNGVPSVCDSAAEQVRGICTDLAGAASTASSLAPSVRTAWQGQAGNAFCASLDAATESSRLTVAAWDRVKDELVRYATRLRDIQARGDQIRSALSSAEGSLSTAKKTLARYEKDDDTAAWRITHARGTVASLTDDIATQTVALDNLRAERQALDNDVAAALHSAPGAGAAAWQAIAYRNGRTVPKTDILDELLDLLDRDPTGNLDLLHQFLLMHSNDAELMGTFFDGLGARGLIDLMRRAGPGGTATFIFGLLATGFVTASSGWSSDKQRAFGAALVNAIDPDTVSSLTSDQELLARLLASPGVPPHVGLGAFARLDALRHLNPTRFAAITAPLGGPPGAADFTFASLSNTLFLLMSQIPTDARRYFADRGEAGFESVQYWYGEHPWAGDGFEGPAALLHAITTDATLRTHDHTDTAWTATLKFLGHAVTALAGNSDLSIAAMSPAASLHIAGALAHVMPEIAGLLTGSNRVDDRWGLVAEVLVDGSLVTVRALQIAPGPLARVLGIALQDTRALELFAGDLERYLRAAHTYVTSALDYDDASRVWMSTGVLYGFTHGALGHQFELAAEAKTDDVESAARALDRFLSLIPVPSTGKVVFDVLIEGAVGSIPDMMVAASDASSHQEIKQLVIDHREEGKERLIGSWADLLIDVPIDNVTEENLRSSINHWYDVFGNAAGNPNPSGSFGLTPAENPDTCEEETNK